MLRYYYSRFSAHKPHAKKQQHRPFESCQYFAVRQNAKVNTLYGVFKQDLPPFIPRLFGGYWDASYDLVLVNADNVTVP